ncbi:MAG: hypothetical protein KJ955_08530 [Nanoarchaeota archaeon]|nr:hypothetical protein [Nanoarchaeota archaeon]
MRQYIAALTLATIAGCVQPGFDEDLDTYAPACDNKPHVSGTFREFSIDCGEYHLEQQQTDFDCTLTLDRNYEGCTEQWHNGNCHQDDVLDLWSKSCPVYDEEGILISNTNEFSRLPNAEQNQQYQDAKINIGYEAGRQRWNDWNNY